MDTHIRQGLKLVALRINLLVEGVIVVRLVRVLNFVGSSVVFSATGQRLLWLQRGRDGSAYAKSDKQRWKMHDCFN